MFKKTKATAPSSILLQQTRRKSRRRTAFLTFVLTTIGIGILGDRMEKKGKVRINTKNYQSPAVKTD